MTEQLDTAYTEQEAKEYDERRFSSAGGSAVHDVEFGHVARFLEAAGAGLKSKVLEVGCGTGRLLVELPALGSVAGLDLSAPMLEQARTLLGPESPVELVEGNAADMAIDSDSFDCVYSVRLLNRVGTKAVARQIVSEIVRVARPGGLVLIEMTNSARLHRGKGTVAFRQREFEQILAAADLDLVQVEGSFVLGIGPWTGASRRFLSIAQKMDTLFASRFPWMCARVYFTAQVRAD